MEVALMLQTGKILHNVASYIKKKKYIFFILAMYGFWGHCDVAT